MITLGLWCVLLLEDYFGSKCVDDLFTASFLFRFFRLRTEKEIGIGKVSREGNQRHVQIPASLSTPLFHDTALLLSSSSAQLCFSESLINTQ